MSILSMAVFFDRLIVFMKAKADPDAFVDAVAAMLDGMGKEDALAHCAKAGKPVGNVCAEILRNAGNRPNMEKAAHNAMQAELNKLETLVPLLATVASTAPFVGLLGTVVGGVRNLGCTKMGVAVKTDRR